LLQLCFLYFGNRWLYLTRGSLVNGFLAGITLAMAVLPEEFQVILTVFMALGAWRMSKKKVLTRKPSAIETLWLGNSAVYRQNRHTYPK